MVTTIIERFDFRWISRSKRSSCAWMVTSSEVVVHRRLKYPARRKARRLPKSAVSCRRSSWWDIPSCVLQGGDSHQPEHLFDPLLGLYLVELLVNPDRLGNLVADGEKRVEGRSSGPEKSWRCACPGWCLISFSLFFSRSSPSKTTSPPTIRPAGCGTSLMME